MKRLNGYIIATVAALAMGGCRNAGNETPQAEASAAEIAAPEYSGRETELLNAGLVDIQKTDESIAVHIVYATPYNFMGRRLYNGVTHALMLPKTAEMLTDAQQRLKKERLDLSLIVYDAARPLSIQREMWDIVEGTDMERFVANPNNAPGMHNYGAAVDVSLMDCTGHPLAMGSEYDFFGDAARVDIEDSLQAKGIITRREYDNRRLLRKIMTEAGFIASSDEWWHFNSIAPDLARQHLTPIQ